MKSLSTLGLRGPLSWFDSSGGKEVWRSGWADEEEAIDVRFWRFWFGPPGILRVGLFLGFGRGMWEGCGGDVAGEPR